MLIALLGVLASVVTVSLADHCNDTAAFVYQYEAATNEYCLTLGNYPQLCAAENLGLVEIRKEGSTEFRVDWEELQNRIGGEFPSCFDVSPFESLDFLGWRDIDQLEVAFGIAVECISEEARACQPCTDITAFALEYELANDGSCPTLANYPQLCAAENLGLVEIRQEGRTAFKVDWAALEDWLGGEYPSCFDVSPYESLGFLGWWDIDQLENAFGAAVECIAKAAKFCQPCEEISSFSPKFDAASNGQCSTLANYPQLCAAENLGLVEISEEGNEFKVDWEGLRNTIGGEFPICFDASFFESLGFLGWRDIDILEDGVGAAVECIALAAQTCQ